MLELTVPLKANGMPRLKRADMDNLATEVLDAGCPEVLKEPMAVPIQKIMEEDCGLRILTPGYLSMDGSVLGMTVFAEQEIQYRDRLQRLQTMLVSDGDVLLDNSVLRADRKGRFRFTLSHELAHWLLHKAYFQRPMLWDGALQPAFLCRAESVESDRTERQLTNDVDWLEWQADTLGAAMLMPKESFCRAYEEQRNLQGRATDPRPYLAQLFQVSRQAAGIRMRQLRLGAL